MLFDKNFFKVLNFIIWAIRGFARMFGDDDDRSNDDEASNNHMQHMPPQP